MQDFAVVALPSLQSVLDRRSRVYGNVWYLLFFCEYEWIRYVEDLRSLMFQRIVQMQVQLLKSHAMKRSPREVGDIVLGRHSEIHSGVRNVL